MSALDGWIDVCRTGLWIDVRGNEVDVTDGMLSALAEGYRSADPAPVVIGHPETDAPAWGWIDELRVVGDRLQAKLRDIAPQFRQAVTAGRYAGRSLSFTGDKVRHLAFLGGRAPAVDGLAPTSFSAPAERTLIFAAPETDELMAGTANPERVELATREAKLRRREIAADVLGPHVQAGRVLPAETAFLAALLMRLEGDDTIQFAEGGETVEEKPAVMFERFLGGLPKRVEYGELAGGTAPPAPSAPNGGGASPAEARAQSIELAEKANDIILAARRRGEFIRPAEAVAQAKKELGRD